MAKNTKNRGSRISEKGLKKHSEPYPGTSKKSAESPVSVNLRGGGNFKCPKCYTEYVMAIRRKRSDAQIGKVEKTHGVDFGVRSDKQLGKFLKENGYPSLSKALEHLRKKK